MTEDQIDAYVSRRLREVRVAAGVSQEKLAAIVGYNRVTIVHIEKGKQRVPLYRLQSLCLALGCEWADILPPLK